MVRDNVKRLGEFTFLRDPPLSTEGWIKCKQKIPFLTLLPLLI